MADVKISSLPSADLPLAGTEVLPIVQSATTKQVSIENITIGRTVTAANLTSSNAVNGVSGSFTGALSVGGTAAITGAVSLTVPLGVANGGTGATTITGIVKGSGTSAFAAAVQGTDYSLLTRGTAQATTSGTEINFTGIPAGVKKITLMLSGVSTSSASWDLRFQLGTSSGVETTNYEISSGYYGTTTSVAGSSTASGFDVKWGAVAADAFTGQISMFNLSGNLWIVNGSFLSSNSLTFLTKIVGSKSLGGVLDRVRLTTTTGATFDAGTVNIMYES
jgi:hypothetical protein